jgi:hypothetical protein
MTSNLPASVLIAIAKDPDGYEKKLAEFDARREAAEAAEAKAKETAAALANERAEFEAWRTEETAHINGWMFANKGEARKLAEANADLVNRQNAVTVREHDLADLSTQLAEIRQAHEVWRDKLNAQAEALATRDRNSANRESAVTARETAIAEREAKFENRLKQFNAGL